MEAGMNAKERIEKNRSQFVLKERFFSVWLRNLPPQEDKTCPTMWTDGKVMGYNPEWVCQQSESQLTFSNIHELFHVLNRHHLRRNGRDSKRWNKACDYAINVKIARLGYELPKGILYNEEYDGKSPEEIYSLLGNQEQEQEKEQDSDKNSHDKNGSNGRSDSSPADGEQEQGESENSDPGGYGEIRDMKNEDGSELSEAEKTAAEVSAKMIMSQAERVAQQAGQITTALSREIKELQKPEKDWRAELASYVQQNSKSDYNWMSPNRRYIHSGLYLPSLKSPDIGNVVLVADSSGSVYQKIWDGFISEMKSLMEMLNLKLTVIVCDYVVREVREEITSEEIQDIKASGGCSTDFRPPFKWLEENGIEPDLLIYFTDLECYNFPPEPSFPVVWASWGRDYAPFGNVIKIK